MARGKTRELAELLEEKRSVTEANAGHNTVEFSVDYGEYDALTSRVMSVIVEHGGTLYSDDMCKLDYTVVV